jgi:hypothetical protein
MNSSGLIGFFIILGIVLLFGFILAIILSCKKSTRLAGGIILLFYFIIPGIIVICMHFNDKNVDAIKNNNNQVQEVVKNNKTHTGKSSYYFIILSVGFLSFFLDLSPIGNLIYPYYPYDIGTLIGQIFTLLALILAEFFLLFGIYRCKHYFYKSNPKGDEDKTNIVKSNSEKNESKTDVVKSNIQKHDELKMLHELYIKKAISKIEYDKIKKEIIG